MPWYRLVRLPYADITKLLAERGVHVDASTVFDGVLRDGFYRLGEPTGDSRIPHAPRLVRAWDDLTRILTAA